MIYSKAVNKQADKTSTQSIRTVPYQQSSLHEIPLLASVCSRDMKMRAEKREKYTDLNG